MKTICPNPIRRTRAKFFGTAKIRKLFQIAKVFLKNFYLSLKLAAKIQHLIDNEQKPYNFRIVLIIHPLNNKH
jgi:hypothetical protein